MNESNFDAIPYLIRPGKPKLRLTYQFLGEIPFGHSKDRLFLSLVNTIYGWVQSKYPERISPSALQGEFYQSQLPGITLESLSVVSDQNYKWALRFTHPDTDIGSQRAIPGRTWIYDIALYTVDDVFRIAIKIGCATQPQYEHIPVSYLRPKLIVELAEHYEVLQLVHINKSAWMLSEPDDIEALYRYLTHPKRTLPTVLLTQPDKRKFPGNTPDYILQPTRASESLLGLAKVVCIPWSLGFEWSNRVGRIWSAYNGAVRTYMPYLDFERDLPHEHPLTFPEKIMSWEYNQSSGEDAYRSFLKHRLGVISGTKRMNWEATPFLMHLKPEYQAEERKRVYKTLEKAKSSSNEVAILRDAVTQLQEELSTQQTDYVEKIKELEDESEAFNDDALQASRDLNIVKNENAKLRSQLMALRDGMEKEKGVSPDAEITIPSTYDDLPDWVETHLVGRLRLLPRALKGLKNAQYNDIALVYKSLILLASEYRKKMIYGREAVEAYEEKRDALGLRDGISIKKEQVGQFGDEYIVRYPIGTEQKRTLDQHLRKGSTKDDHLCLAIYFFWDQEDQVVVVGWLPSHLDNRMT